MGVAWTSEQVLALSPDAGSAKRGRSLAHVAKWPLLGKSPRAVWGECQGSGKKPYRTVIDLDIDLGGPAFRCSCPSRKFPCKHAIALFLLLTEQASFIEEQPPDWGAEWLDKRAEKAAQKPSEKQATDPAAQTQQAQKRLTKREEKVAAGLDDLGQWLQDIVRRGLADLPAQPYSFWDQAAARLVDAQAPGLAKRVQALAGIPHASALAGRGNVDWLERMLKALGQLNLLVQSYRNIAQLSPAMQAEVRSQVGFTQTKDDLYQRAEQSEPTVAALSDTWQILGKVVTEEDALKTQRVWLWGLGSQQTAMVLSFAHGRRQPLDASLVPGACFNGRLIFYPGTGQQGTGQETGYRALVAERTTVPDVCRDSIGDKQIEAAIARYAQSLIQNPWLVRAPMALSRMLLRYSAHNWYLQDAEGKTLPLSPTFSQGWELLAMSGGHPLAIFGEWNGESLLPLSVWSDKKIVALEA